MKRFWVLTVVLSCCAQLPLTAQSAEQASALPTAPLPILNLSLQAGAVPPSGAPAGQPQRLTRVEAENLAIRNNPRIRVGQLLALAQHQVVRESRSAELPTLNGAITAVDAEDGSRVSAGYLTASRLVTHAGAGGSLTQLLTDFGRTHNLILSQKLAEKAANANAVATKQEIVLATDEAFYSALSAHAILQVAQQTVDTRQTTQTQVNQMTNNKLKSTLDLSFADVNLSQGRLLQLDAQNNADAAMATLDSVLGLDHSVVYDLIDDTTALTAQPPDSDQLIQTALQQRPDLQAFTYDQQSSQKYARAEWEQMLPSITAAGTGGSVPIRPDQYYISNWWGAVGVNMSIPIFNGFLYSSQAKEAEYHARAAQERTRDLRDRIVRDVRTAWLNANTAYQRVGVTAELVKEANLALQLAQTRYTLGLSSIVELSQAQLQQTSAAIDNTNAQYQYRLALATINYQIGANP
jgi:outer membrane protein